MLWSICTMTAKKQNIFEFVVSGSGFGVLSHLSKFGGSIC